MAIIDTSKGVRPCVEELANLEELKYAVDNENVEPLFNYRTNPESFKPDFSSSLASWVNNQDNSYTITVEPGLTTNNYIIYSYPLELDSLQLYESPTAGYVVTESFVGILFQDKQVLNGVLQLIYKDKDGLSHSSLNVQSPTYAFRRISIPQNYLPISEVKIQVGARIRSDSVGTQQSVLFYYNLFRLPIEMSNIPTTKNSFIPSLGFIEKSNQCMCDNYLAKQGATIYTTPTNGIKYYH